MVNLMEGSDSAITYAFVRKTRVHIQIGVRTFICIPMFLQYASSDHLVGEASASRFAKASPPFCRRDTVDLQHSVALAVIASKSQPRCCEAWRCPLIVPRLACHFANDGIRIKKPDSDHYSSLSKSSDHRLIASCKVGSLLRRVSKGLSK